MTYASRRPPDTGKNWAYAIYARVLLQQLEDLERSRTQHQANAIKWFTEEPQEVAIVSAICALKPVWVYREVARRLRGMKIKSRRITFIRWHLRHGDQLSEINVKLVATDRVEALELAAA